MRQAMRAAPAVVFSLFACSAEEPAPSLEELDLVMFNGLSPDALPNHGDELNVLAQGALNGASTQLTTSQEGLELLTDVVGCALETGQSATFQRPGQSDLVLSGELGIATNWRDQAIGEQDQRFVTACLIARVNALDFTFPISVRSSRRDADLTEGALFPNQEMGTFGNAFAPPGQRTLSVCFGEAVADATGGLGGLGTNLGLPNYTVVRLCAQPEDQEACGFNFVGGCAQFGGVPEVACENRSGSLFSQCHDEPIPQPSPAHDEVVSVFVNSADLGLLLTEYVDILCDILGLPIPLCPLLNGLPLPL